MKKFEFHLDGLLRVKRQLENLADMEFQKAQLRVQAAVAKVTTSSMVSVPGAWVSHADR